MKITVCQIGDTKEEFRASWDRLIAHVQKQKPDLILLPEMSFYPWFCKEKRFNPVVWKEAVEAHEESSGYIKELSSACVLGSRPIEKGTQRLNQAFIWTPQNGFFDAHTKYHLPDEDGFWEASWYHRGDGEFRTYSCASARVGFLICTDMWFFEHARFYGKAGAQIIACPRSTPKSTLDKWLTGGRTVSVVSGAFCISSNKYSSDDLNLGGLGWITDPEGHILGVTSQAEPILTVEVDLDIADRAKKTYPRYVPD
jgi:N-carbamoylputrescine amidase